MNIEAAITMTGDLLLPVFCLDTCVAYCCEPTEAALNKI